MKAGPSFELFYESDYLLPHREAAWALLIERLDVAAEFCQQIVTGQPSSSQPPVSQPPVSQPPVSQPPVSQPPANVAAALTPIGDALAGTAQALAAYLPAGDPRSRPAAPGTSGTAAPTAAEAAALLARAGDFDRTRHAAPLPAGLAEDIAGVFDRTQAIVTRLLRPGADDLAHPGANDAALAWTTPWLVSSVLRPLADLLSRLAAAPATPLAAPSATLETPRPEGPIASGSTASGTSLVSDLLWQATLAATRLRVGLHGTGSAPPDLAEAVGALQTIACALAPAADPAAGRVAQLRSLQAGLPASIQTAPDGPYLVTNVPDIRTQLGLPLPVPPQVALCRCGGSARKPFCDGSHADNGFSDAKDPKRVPDRRDTYHGEQVTIFDNRGICQHSGLCTDRLSTVFRTDAEPFVAPSGGRMDEIVRAVRDCPSGALSLAFDGPDGPEERDLADWHGRREPAIEITQDGPYRVTGGIELSGPDGEDVGRAEGFSREHYALCRCGRSQNKPFCSGMHWYIGFTDPQRPPGRPPSLFEWAGGLPKLTRMTRLLYEKHVPADALLAELFADVPPGYPQREALRIGAAFGAPIATGPVDGVPGVAGAPAGDEVGGAGEAAAQPPATPEFTSEQLARWIRLASQAAAEAGLPADPEFRAALAAFLAWDAPAALARSAGGAQGDSAGGAQGDSAGGAQGDSAGGAQGDSAGGAQDDGKLPVWDWTPAGPPSTAPTTADTDAEPEPVTLPGPGEPVSFAAHIKPMFRAKDRQSMQFAFDLWSYSDVQAHAAGILGRLSDGTMPCDGAWPSAQVEVFRRWTESGTPA